MRRRRSSSGAAGLLWPLLGACLWASVVGYKPVIIVHGLFDSSGDFINLQRFINEVSVGANGEADSGDIKVYFTVNPAGLTGYITTCLSAKRGPCNMHLLLASFMVRVIHYLVI